MSQTKFVVALVASVSLALAVAACDRDDIHAYRAPKTLPEAPQQMASSPASQVVWDLPEGWRSVANDQPMRIATFRAGAGEGVEVSVTAFPGDVGGLLANVNRWRGQIGLAPAQEADLATMVKTIHGQGGDISLVDFTGSDGKELLAVIIRPGDGKSWFVKATAAPDAVNAIRESFDKFAKSVRMGAAAAPAPAPGMDQMTAPGAPPIAPNPASGEVAARLSSWTPPANWAPDAQASGIVAAAYIPTNPQGSARVTATSLFGEGGGTLMNINRWREQLSLSPVSELSQQPTVNLGKGALEVDLADPGNTKRMIAVILLSQDQTWFFKMTGAPPAVGAEKAAFDQFVRTVGLGGK